MPYIITTKRRTHRCTNPAHEQVSRRAVATLADAQAYTSGLISGILPWPSDPPATQAAADQLWNLSEPGGAVGPLPDGTVIEVEFRTWSGLRVAVGLAERGRTYGPKVIAAFNAKEAT